MTDNRPEPIKYKTVEERANIEDGGAVSTSFIAMTEDEAGENIGTIAGTMHEDGTITFSLMPQTPEQHGELLLTALSDMDDQRETLKTLTDERAQYPYNKDTYELFSGDKKPVSKYRALVFAYQASTDDARERANEITGGGIVRVNNLIRTIERDHGETIGALQDAVKDNPDILEEVGITTDELDAQAAHLLYMDIDEMYAFMFEQAEKALVKVIDEPIPLSSVAITKRTIDHSSRLKSLYEGITEIAMGEERYIYKTKKGNRTTILEGGEEITSKFIEAGGGAFIALNILSVIRRMSLENNGETFLYRGRRWFTANSITREARRSKNRTIEVRGHQSDVNLVNLAIETLASIRMREYDKDELISADSLIHATLKKKITTDDGITHHNVWGFSLQDDSLFLSALDDGIIWDYPLPGGAPPKLQGGGYYCYILDRLREPRGKLYTKYGNPSRTIKTYKIEIKWDTVYKGTRPLISSELDKRQKAAIRKSFIEELQSIAESEYNKEIDRERPLYIDAESIRSAGGTGKGKGTPYKLVITCSNRFHKPKIAIS